MRKKRQFLEQIGLLLHLQIIPLLLNKALADIFGLILGKREIRKSTTLVLFMISFKKAQKEWQD
jgi:hypothetical protein